MSNRQMLQASVQKALSFRRLIFNLPASLPTLYNERQEPVTVHYRFYWYMT